MAYQTILFDMDGTVLDTLEDLWASTNAVLRALGRPERTLAEIRSFVGNGAANQIRCAMPAGSSDEAVADALARYRVYYAAHCREHTRPYPGVVPMLETLAAAGRRLAVVSNKPDFAVQTLAKEIFPGCFDLAVGEQTGVRRKPAPDMTVKAMKDLKVSKANAVYVGDSEVDLATARNSELPCIAVSWGFRWCTWGPSCPRSTAGPRSSSWTSPAPSTP